MCGHRLPYASLAIELGNMCHHVPRTCRSLHSPSASSQKCYGLGPFIDSGILKLMTRVSLPVFEPSQVCCHRTKGFFRSEPEPMQSPSKSRNRHPMQGALPQKVTIAFQYWLNPQLSIDWVLPLELNGLMATHAQAGSGFSSFMV